MIAPQAVYALYGHRMKRRFNRSMFDRNIFEKAKDMIGNVTKFQSRVNTTQFMWSVTNSSKILVTRKASFVTTIYIRWMQPRKMHDSSS